MNAETLGGYERGDTVPDHKFLTLYREKFDISLNWLITGKGDMFFEVTPPPRAVAAMLSDINFAMIPLYEVAASAGPGSVPTHEAVDGMIAFDRQFLRERGAVPERCSVIETRGDSMQPTIPDGSLLIVDHSQTNVGNGAIYVIGVSDTVLVKRVRLRFDGAVELASDNTAYAPEIINRDQLADLRVIGKVVYYCRVP